MPNQHKRAPLSIRLCILRGVGMSDEARERKRERAQRYRENRDPEAWREYNREYQRKWSAANRERIGQYQRARIDRSLASYLLVRARSRAKTAGIPFDITLEDVAIPETCPILGIPLLRGEKGKAAAGSPTLDRIIPELGYVRGNVQVISHRANSMKRDATLAELVRLGEWAAMRIERQGDTHA